MTDPLRVGHMADLHLLLTRYGNATGQGVNSRVLDFIGTLERFVAECIERRVHVAVLAGDTFNNRHEGPWVRAAFAKALASLTAAGIVVIVLPGNHDGQTTVGDPESHSLRWLANLNLPKVIVPMQPMRAMLIAVQGGPGAVNLTAYPYPHKRAFDEQLAHLDPDDRVLAAGRLLEDHIADVGAHLDRASKPVEPLEPRLFVGHLTVGGASVGSEQSMKFSWDVAISPHVLEPWDYAALGHIHKQQQVPGSTKAWYAGSPEVIDFSEVGDTKGFLFATVRRGEPPEVESVPSGARPAVKLVYNQGPDGNYASVWPDGVSLAGAIVLAEFRPTSKPDQAQQASIERALLAEGASFVKSVTIRPEAPAPTRIAVTEGQSIEDQTRAYLVANDLPLEPTMTAAKQVIAHVGGPA